MFQFFRATPDIALVKLERQVKFSSYVRPICLNFKRNEKPVCPDQSRDRETQRSLGRLLKRYVLGGCATVAGWGYRYNQLTMDDEKYANCRTNFDDFNPDKLE